MHNGCPGSFWTEPAVEIRYLVLCTSQKYLYLFGFMQMQLFLRNNILAYKAFRIILLFLSENCKCFDSLDPGFA
jgi:hypothetical protein